MGILTEATSNIRDMKFKRAANRDSAYMLYLKGWEYHTGIRAKQNYEEAYRYYKLAADQGERAAQEGLGRLYENGHGVKQDYEEAFRYYKLAADQGLETAQEGLGRLYEKGYLAAQEAEEPKENCGQEVIEVEEEATELDEICEQAATEEEEEEPAEETANEEASGYTFISYSTKNQMVADSVNNLLHEEGIKTWMAPYNIPAGSKYAAVITRALKECACLVLILSNDSQNSTWVGNEVERAMDYKKPIIPIQIEDVILNDEFEFYISTTQIVTVQKIDKESKDIQSVLASVKALTNV